MADFGWYRYNVLNQYPLIQRLIECSAISVDRLIGPGRVADIGCADGDSVFFLESLGCRVDACTSNGDTENSDPVRPDADEPLSLAFELDKALAPGLDIRELGIIISSVAID